MPQQSETQKPAQVPGDAESPPRREPDHTAGKAVNETDRTEPTQAPHHPQRQDAKPD
ncbi:MAG TPA: hypothetical protein VME47_13630 [Acetobacteraceae bacterium]|nr:hypothetical protein [Acetobacteraceae bacterium]